VIYFRWCEYEILGSLPDFKAGIEVPGFSCAHPIRKVSEIRSLKFMAVTNAEGPHIAERGVTPRIRINNDNFSLLAHVLLWFWVNTL
jgi:hypothetical protein